MRHPLIGAALAAAGYALIVPGQIATIYLDEAMIWIAGNLGDPGRRLLNLAWPGFPPGAFAAVASILVGTIMVAIAAAGVRLEAEGRGSARDSDAPAATGGGRDGVFLFLAIALAAATFALCLGEAPSNLAVLAWIASIGMGFAAFATIDRDRGTRLRLPRGAGREWLFVALLSAAAMVVAAHDLNSWRWSGTPDESAFFGVAKALADNPGQRFLLSERGVFEVHPVLSSVYQAVFIAVLGPDGFAWRLSSVAAVVGSLPALYVLARSLWNRRVALIATALFATTPVAVGFAHLGYNNTQVYPVVLGSLACALWAHRCRSMAGLYLAGVVVGLGFFTYYPARFALVPVLWLLACLGGFGVAAAGRRNAAVVLFALGVAIVPVLVDPQATLARMFRFTSFTGGGRDPIDGIASVWQVVSGADYFGLANQTLLSLLYSVYFIGPHHFQWPPVVDPVSGPLVLVGLWLCCIGWRRRGMRFLAVTFVLSAFVIGGTSHYFRPPLTRLLFLSPFAALLAGVALDRMAAGLAELTRSPRIGTGFAAFMTLCAAVLGIGMQQYNVRERYHGYGDGTTAELLRLAMQEPADVAFVYVQRPDTSMWSVDEIFAEYGMRERLKYHHGYDDAARESLESVQPPFLVVLGLGDEGQRTAAERSLLRRFPSSQWQSSDPERSWNLRCFRVVESR